MLVINNLLAKILGLNLPLFKSLLGIEIETGSCLESNLQYTSKPDFSYLTNACMYHSEFLYFKPCIDHYDVLTG